MGIGHADAIIVLTIAIDVAVNITIRAIISYTIGKRIIGIGVSAVVPLRRPHLARIDRSRHHERYELSIRLIPGRHDVVDSAMRRRLIRRRISIKQSLDHCLPTGLVLRPIENRMPWQDLFAMILRPVAKHAVCNLRVDVVAPDSSADTLRRASSR